MILIKSVQVIDGTGKPPFKADVLLSGDKISAVGSFPNKKAELVINGLGHYLTPGFIDVNTDSDHYLSLFTNPSQKDFLIQGVTTIIGGLCGSSLAPLLYGSLESIQKWADVNQINVDWHTLAELFEVLGRFKIGVNFGTLIGHSTIRRAIIGEELRDLTENELRVFEHALENGLVEGALGLSTGLGYVHSQMVPYAEIKRLAKIVVKYDGVYATHLRNEKDKLLEAVGETIKLAKETGVKTLISHFRPLVGYQSNFEAAMQLIEKQAARLDFHFDGYPFEESVAPIYTLLPDWVKSGGLEVMLAHVSAAHLKDRLIKELAHIKGKDIVIAQASKISYLVGKSLADFAENRELSPPQALLELMKATGLRALVFYKNIDEELAIKALMGERGIVASNGAGLPERKDFLKHERFYNTFPKFLKIVKELKTMPLEKAIEKITSAPARKFNLKSRGIVKEGFVADLVMLADDTTAANVFVSGQLAVQDGKFTGNLTGKLIKRS